MFKDSKIIITFVPPDLDGNVYQVILANEKCPCCYPSCYVYYVKILVYCLAGSTNLHSFGMYIQQ